MKEMESLKSKQPFLPLCDRALLLSATKGPQIRRLGDLSGPFSSWRRGQTDQITTNCSLSPCLPSSPVSDSLLSLFSPLIIFSCFFLPSSHRGTIIIIDVSATAAKCINTDFLAVTISALMSTKQTIVPFYKTVNVKKGI